jgi:hypothetical protein
MVRASERADVACVGFPREVGVLSTSRGPGPSSETAIKGPGSKLYPDPEIENGLVHATSVHATLKRLGTKVKRIVELSCFTVTEVALVADRAVLSGTRRLP